MIAYAFSRAVLSEYLSIPPDRIVISRTPGGKPFVQNQVSDDLDFSISHCENFVAVAVGRKRLIGVDIEETRAQLEHERVANLFLAPEEAEELKRIKTGQAAAFFARLWTCKESFVKAVGMGLSYPLDRFCVAGLEQGSPRFSRVDPPFGPPARWSLQSFSLRRDCFVSVAIGHPVKHSDENGR